MKVEIPIIGNKDGKPVVDEFFENVCRIANLNIGIIIGCSSNNIEDNTRTFIYIKDNVEIKKKYQNTSKEILNIYPNRPNKILVYYLEVQINDDRLDLLSEEEIKLLIKN